MNNQYPIVFLMERARRHGYSIFIGEEAQGEKTKKYLYFGPSQALRDITYKLEWGKSLVSFKPTLSTTHQVSEVTVCGWDRKAKQKIEETVTVDQIENVNADMKHLAKAVGRKEVITDQPVYTKDAAKKLAHDLLSGQLQEIVEASGVTVGLPDLRAGRSVDIEKIGYRLSGRFFIKETSHAVQRTGVSHDLQSPTRSDGGPKMTEQDFRHRRGNRERRRRSRRAGPHFAGPRIHAGKTRDALGPSGDADGWFGPRLLGDAGGRRRSRSGVRSRRSGPSVRARIHLEWQG